MGLYTVLCTRVLNILSVTPEIMFVLFEGVRLDACGSLRVEACFQAENFIGLSVNHPKATQAPLVWMFTVEKQCVPERELEFTPWNAIVLCIFFCMS